MPSKLRKAIGAVKDQTSISLAKVSSTSASNLEVLILKATRHDAAPIDERYVNEVLNLVSSNKVYAAACAQAIAKRIGKTKNWIVALKSLMLVLRIFQDGDPYFPREVLHVMKRGARVLNLSTFRDDSNSNPWDYTAFVRTFALYLDERLDCFLTAKLQRRFTKRDMEKCPPRSRRVMNDSISEMKPSMLLDKISAWQNLLDRAVATRPTGAAKSNKLVLIALYTVVQESFDLHRDLSDGLALLLDGFFQLPYQSCVNAFKTCVKASKQNEELCSFYDLCKSIGVGRTSEYPSVQKISEELIETLQAFLKDQDSFHRNGQSPPHLSLPMPLAKDSSSNPDKQEISDLSSEPTDRNSTEYASQCASLEDFLRATVMGTSPPNNCVEQYLEHFDDQSLTEVLCAADPSSSLPFPADKGSMSPVGSALGLALLDDWPQEDQDQESEQGHRASEGDACSAHSFPADQGTSSGMQSASDPVSLDDWPPKDQKQEAEQGQGAPGFDSCVTHSLAPDQDVLVSARNSAWEQASTDGWQAEKVKEEDDELQHTSTWDSITSEYDNWEAALAWPESLPIQPLPNTVNPSGTNTLNELVDQDASTVPKGFESMAMNDKIALSSENQYNPFLQDTPQVPVIAATSYNQMAFKMDDISFVAPTFQAISSQSPAVVVLKEDDPFAPFTAEGSISNGLVDQENVQREKQLWLQNQERIIAKNMS